MSGSLDGLYRLIRIEDIPEWEAKGWVVVASLGNPHGCYSVLMQQLPEVPE